MILGIHPKVTSATAACAAAILVVWILSLFGITVPDVVYGALVIVFTFAGGWLTPSPPPTN